MNKSESAGEFFNSSEVYNCAQSVLYAFRDELNIDGNDLLLISSAFGGGIAQLREVCGAVTGMFMAAGLKYGFNNPEQGKNKEELYEFIRKLTDQFKQEFGSIKCGELLELSESNGLGDSSERQCTNIVKYAVALLESEIDERGKTDGRQ